MQGTATTKANQIDFFWIESPQDFIPCMTAVGAIGFSGSLTSTVTDGQITWQLILNSPAQSGVEAGVGQVVVWDQRQLTIFPNSDAFLALYTVP
jgi:hypothetical protein